MLIYSMGVSVDGFIADREGAFGWTVPDEEQFRFHIAQISELGGYLCGRRLYETGRENRSSSRPVGQVSDLPSIRPIACR
jgi:hypothetical protein